MCILIRFNFLLFRHPGLLSGTLLLSWSNYQENHCGFTNLLECHKWLLPAITCPLPFLCVPQCVCEAGIHRLEVLHSNLHLASQLHCWQQLWHLCLE